MPAVLKLDTLLNSELVLNAFQSSYVRTGIISQIDTAGLPSDVMWNAINTPGFPAMGAQLPNHPQLLLQNVRVYPLAGNCCRVELTYQTATFGAPTTYILTDDSYLTQRTTAINPVTHELIKVKFKSTINPRFVIPEDIVEMSYMQPCRALTVTALSYGQPPGYGDLVGSVNNATWQGKGKGCWLLWRYSTSLAKYSGYYTLNATALTRSQEDWSELGYLRDRNSGVAAVPENIPVPNNDYKPGHIQTGNGIIREGLYPMSNFAAVFGFN